LLALARRLGFRGAGAAAEFEAARARHGAVVRGAFAALFHGAEEERRREAEPELALLIDELDQAERALWRLGRLGFRDLESAYRELRLLRDGPPHAPASVRRRAALVRLAPALLTEISRSAAPEPALHHRAPRGARARRGARRAGERGPRRARARDARRRRARLRLGPGPDLRLRPGRSGVVERARPAARVLHPHRGAHDQRARDADARGD